MEVKKRKQCFKPYNLINNQYVTIMWDFKPITKTNASGETFETPLATWQEYQFKYIPTLSEIKKVIIDYYNKEIDNKILTGLTWNNMSIWLSTENQFNYKTAYDLCVQTNGEMLPIIFKFGDNENSIYYEFKDMEEFSDFYKTSVKFVQNTLQEGWLKKESINWNIYTK